MYNRTHSIGIEDPILRELVVLYENFKSMESTRANYTGHVQNWHTLPPFLKEEHDEFIAKAEAKMDRLVEEARSAYEAAMKDPSSLRGTALAKDFGIIGVEYPMPKDEDKIISVIEQQIYIRRQGIKNY